jgi:hypothetical protein
MWAISFLAIFVAAYRLAGWSVGSISKKGTLWKSSQKRLSWIFRCKASQMCNVPLFHKRHLLYTKSLFWFSWWSADLLRTEWAKHSTLVSNPYTELNEAQTMVGCGFAALHISKIFTSPAMLLWTYEPGFSMELSTPTWAA